MRALKALFSPTKGSRPRDEDFLHGVQEILAYLTKKAGKRRFTPRRVFLELEFYLCSEHRVSWHGEIETTGIRIRITGGEIQACAPRLT